MIEEIIVDKYLIKVLFISAKGAARIQCDSVAPHPAWIRPSQYKVLKEGRITQSILDILKNAKNEKTSEKNYGNIPVKVTVSWEADNRKVVGVDFYSECKIDNTFSGGGYTKRYRLFFPKSLFNEKKSTLPRWIVSKKVAEKMKELGISNNFTLVPA